MADFFQLGRHHHCPRPPQRLGGGGTSSNKQKMTVTVVVAARIIWVIIVESTDRPTPLLSSTLGTLCTLHTPGTALWDLCGSPKDLLRISGISLALVGLCISYQRRSFTRYYVGCISHKKGKRRQTYACIFTLKHTRALCDNVLALLQNPANSVGQLFRTHLVFVGLLDLCTFFRPVCRCFEHAAKDGVLYLHHHSFDRFGCSSADGQHCSRNFGPIVSSAISRNRFFRYFGECSSGRGTILPHCCVAFWSHKLPTNILAQHYNIAVQVTHKTF